MRPQKIGEGGCAAIPHRLARSQQTADPGGDERQPDTNIERVKNQTSL
jgi:hypothetical protein